MGTQNRFGGAGAGQVAVVIDKYDIALVPGSRRNSALPDSASALAQIVMLVLARADSLRAIWNEACRSLAVLVRRLFAVNSVRLGTPSVRMIPTIVQRDHQFVQREAVLESFLHAGNILRGVQHYPGSR